MSEDKFNLVFKEKKIHFIGIGGIGMSALARYYFANRSVISGSDKEESDLIDSLRNEGIKNIWTPHNKKNIETIDPDYVIYSTAVLPTNEEFIWANENKKNILHRSDLLEQTANAKKLISVSGTHGKTTTSAMISEILINNNLNPSVILGGILISRDKNIIIGNGDYFVVEADESDKSFLKGSPEIAVITNIEPDHLENYQGGFEEIKKSFLEFAKKSILKKGLVVCLQDKETKEIINKNFDLKDPKLITYEIQGQCESAKLSAKHNPKSNSWDIYLFGDFKTSLKLNSPGEHNVLNALAAFGVGYLIGLPPEKIKESLENYQGVKRRFQILTKSKDITIIDDYAHHPTEIKAAINAAKELNPKRLIVILQPHQPTRVRDLWDDFTAVLSKEDCPIFVTDIYIARGSEIKGISSQKLVEEISKPNVNYLPGDINQILESLKKIIKPGDLILILGAGNITNLGSKLLKFYERVASKSGNN